MKTQLENLKNEVGKIQVTGLSGAGMVKITINGEHKAEKVEIDPSLLSQNNKDILETLLLGALNDANLKLEEELKKLSSSIPMSNLGF